MTMCYTASSTSRGPRHRYSSQTDIKPPFQALGFQSSSHSTTLSLTVSLSAHHYSSHSHCLYHYYNYHHHYYHYYNYHHHYYHYYH